MLTQTELNWLEDAYSADSYAPTEKIDVDKVEFSVNECSVFAKYRGKTVAGAELSWSSGNLCVLLLATTPKHRGCGIGQELVRRIISFAKEKDSPRVYLAPKPSSVSFYQKLGFRFCSGTRNLMEVLL